jgi:hypothetical protein
MPLPSRSERRSGSLAAAEGPSGVLANATRARVAEIAERLHPSPRTVAQPATAVLAKPGVRARTRSAKRIGSAWPAKLGGSPRQYGQAHRCATGGSVPR